MSNQIQQDSTVSYFAQVGCSQLGLTADQTLVHTTTVGPPKLALPLQLNVDEGAHITVATTVTTILQAGVYSIGGYFGIGATGPNLLLDFSLYCQITSTYDSTYNNLIPFRSQLAMVPGSTTWSEVYIIPVSACIYLHAGDTITFYVQNNSKLNDALLAKTDTNILFTKIE